MQVAARLCSDLFEVFFPPMSRVRDYAWHRNLVFK